MIICVLLCCPVSIHMSQLLSTERPIPCICYCLYFTIEERVTAVYLAIELTVKLEQKSLDLYNHRIVLGFQAIKSTRVVQNFLMTIKKSLWQPSYISK